MYLTNFFLAVFSGVCLSLMLLFFYLFQKAREKQLKAEDMLLENKKELFHKKFSVMRDDEKVLFQCLEQVIGDRYYIFPQVHLTELIYVKEGKEDHENLYQILGRKSVDFAIFDKQNIAPIAAIELNGESHYPAKQKGKDEEKKMLFASVGIGFVIIQKASLYDTQALQKLLSQYLSLTV